MSLQFNFFALASDYEVILIGIAQAIPGALVLPGLSRGAFPPAKELCSPGDLLSYGPMVPVAIVSPNSLALLKVRAAPSGSRIDFRQSPALECFPSLPVGLETTKVGRIAVFYERCDEGCSPDKPFLRLVRALRKHARRVPRKSQFWIFKDAAARSRLLQYWVGDPSPNPLVDGEAQSG